ncbi:MAG: M61 family metallopeptidase [Planctomycetota bacterium]
MLLDPAHSWQRYLAALLLSSSAWGFQEAAMQDVSTASYRIELVATAPPRFAVRATLPSSGSQLSMATSWSMDVPEVAEAGWPGLVRSLSVADAEGRAVTVTETGSDGWNLVREVDGLLTLDYEVDYAPLAQRGWPAPRETAYVDDDRFVVIGRSLFITTPAQQASELRFTLPHGWQAVLPWSAPSGPSGRDAHVAAVAEVASAADLTENVLAFVQGVPDVLTVQGFDLKVVAFGPWQPAGAEVQRVLSACLQRLVALIGFEGRGDYVVILLPQLEDGGESFRASFALNTDEVPSRANLGRWGNTITHELFHYWNGWQLRGAEYAGSQWFQEGFTEYAANLALVSSGMIEPEEFYAKLAQHVVNSRRLTTPLDAPGTSKGSPLYSGGALVAFCWDATIREVSDGERGLGDMLRALMKRTDNGARRYEWADIQAALEATCGPETAASQDWAEFHRRFIHGTEPLPLAATLKALGLALSEREDGTVRIEAHPAATEAEQRRQRAVLGLARGG